MTLDGRNRSFPGKGSIIEKCDNNHQKPAMRRPFLVTHAVSRELTVFGMFGVRKKLSELGWFDGGLGHFLQEKHDEKGHFPAWIHKETPMF